MVLAIEVGGGRHAKSMVYVYMCSGPCLFKEGEEKSLPDQRTRECESQKSPRSTPGECVLWSA